MSPSKPLISLAFVAVSSLAIVFGGGCGKGKIDQCNAFITACNSAAVAQKGIDLSTPEGVKKSVDIFNKSNESIAAVPLEDDKLKALRDAEVKNNKDAVAAIQALDKANTPEDLKKATDKIDALAKDDEKNTADLNAYCK